MKGVELDLIRLRAPRGGSVEAPGVMPKPAKGGSPHSFDAREPSRGSFSFAVKGAGTSRASFFPRPSQIGTIRGFRFSRPSGIGTLGTFGRFSSERKRNLRGVRFRLARAKSNPRDVPHPYGTSEKVPPRPSVSLGLTENDPLDRYDRLDGNRQGTNDAKVRQVFMWKAPGSTPASRGRPSADERRGGGGAGRSGRSASTGWSGCGRA